MLDEVLTHLKLDPKDPDFRVVDATLGLGGHAEAILERTEGKLVGLDRDADGLQLARQNLERFGDRVSLVHANLADLATALPSGQENSPPVDAILMDLGYSSWQLAERGFSFQTDAPLDMRMDTGSGETAADLVSQLPEKELADLIYAYGEEHASRRVAKAIVTARKGAPITTTTQLAEVVREAIPRRGKLDPATKTFQALRIAVNDELGSLERGLTAAEQVLKPGGRVVVISFESLMDRIVKRHFRSSEQLEVITKKVVRPTRDEIRANPRARSAKLRSAARA
jgi:16S rRNA (cytosine1402-N4)-methyltransferase